MSQNKYKVYGPSPYTPKNKQGGSITKPIEFVSRNFKKDLHLDTLEVLPKLSSGGPVGKSSRSLINPINEIIKHGSPNPNIDYGLTGYEYIFMTKPVLNIKENIEYDGFLKYLYDNHRNIVQSLSYEEGGGTFIPFVTNLYEKFDIDDISLNDTTEAESWRGFSQKLPTHSTDTTAGGTFSITYKELQVPLVTYMHKAWVDYIENVRFGFMLPSKEAIYTKTLDFTASLYYFMLEPDGETIRLWAKYTGVTPKNIPYSAFSGEKGSPGLVKPSIQYLYSYREILDPIILTEFNKVSKGTGLTTKKSKAAKKKAQHQVDTGIVNRDEDHLIRDLTENLQIQNETYTDVFVARHKGRYKLVFS